MKRSAATATNAAPLKRCAIYTRKSTTMGLEQEFNTLQAQRDIGESYIRSQSHAGWVAIPDKYDDGGFTGANLDRPAYARLMADVEAGKVDVVVVYKLDRLSRSTLDFLLLGKRLTEAGVAIVSVTEQICTDGPMGRAMTQLIVVLAQLEREQIGERTRDKMAAARRRGKWTGGAVLLGYQVVEKKLVVDELEAPLVREIFDQYREHRSVLVVTQLLNERRRSTKRHCSANGRVRVAHEWTKSDVLRVLRNVIYAGQMRYGTEVHEGEHQAIIERETFEQAGQLLAENAHACVRAQRNPDYLLGGILFCSCCGSAFTAASTRKGAREWRYYRTVRRDQQGREACRSRQLPAGAIEDFVVAQVREATLQANLADELLAAVKTRVDARRAGLGAERSRLPREIAELAAEGSRLVDKIGEVKTGASKLLDRRLEEVGEQLARSEQRLADVEGEIASLDAAEVEAGWVAECLRNFDGVWDSLTAENRGRLIRAVVERVEVDEAANRIQIFMADIGSGTLAGDGDEQARAQEVA